MIDILIAGVGDYQPSANAGPMPNLHLSSQEILGFFDHCGHDLGSQGLG